MNYIIYVLYSLVFLLFLGYIIVGLLFKNDISKLITFIMSLFLITIYPVCLIIDGEDFIFNTLIRNFLYLGLVTLFLKEFISLFIKDEKKYFDLLMYFISIDLVIFALFDYNITFNVICLIISLIIPILTLLLKFKNLKKLNFIFLSVLSIPLLYLSLNICINESFNVSSIFILITSLSFSDSLFLKYKNFYLKECTESRYFNIFYYLSFILLSISIIL